MIKKKVISVIELDYHPEVLRDFLNIMIDTQYQIKVFTTENIWNRVNIERNKIEDNVEVHLKPDSQKVRKFIQKHFQIINQSSLIFFSTLASNFILFSSFKFKPIVLIRIHNSNAFFNKIINNYRPKFTLFYLWKDISHFIRKEIGELDWYYRRKFLNKVDKYVFSSKSIKDFAITKLNIPPESAIYLPISYSFLNQQTPLLEPQEQCEIVVIGKIDKRNRDYDMLYDGFKFALNKTKQRIRLTLLGDSNSNYGKSIISRFQKLESDNFQLTNYIGFVNQNDFQKHTSLADFLIIPVKIHTRYTIYSEMYGYTKISGSINDLIKFKKPSLIFGGYPTDPVLSPITAKYNNSKELGDLIKDWSENQTFRDLDVSTAINEFSLEKVRKLYIDTFDHILKTN